MDRQDHPASRSFRPRNLPLAVLFWLAAAGVPAVAQAQEAQSVEVDFSRWTDQQMEDYLNEAEIGRKEENDVGVNRTLRIALEKDGIAHDAHYTNIDRSNPRQVFQNGDVELNFRDSYKFNIAAYRLDRLIHLNMVPVSIERRVPGEGRGALTWWVDNVQMMERDRRQQDITSPNPQSWSDQMAMGGRVFTALIYNNDPNQTNFLITDDWNLVLIDFTRAFLLFEKLPDVNLGARISRRVYEGLKALNAETLEEAMEDYLDGSRRKALLVRRDLIVQHFDEQIARFGEDEVFWDEPGQ